MSRSGSTVPIFARLTFREAGRRKVLLGALLLSILFLTVYGTGVAFIHRDLVRYGQHSQRVVSVPIYNFLAQSGLYVVNFLTLALAVLTAVDTISGEIDTGTIHTLASKPLRRWEILLGKWLGYALMLTLYLLLMAGGVVLITRWITGYRLPNVLQGIGLMWLNGLLLLNLTLLGGTRLSTLANGVLVFATYGVAFIGGWVEQIGGFLGNEAAVTIGIVSSLLMPSEALWKRAAYEMRTVLADAIGPNPLLMTLSVPSVAMVLYAVVYALVVLGLALWSFARRDL